MCRSLKAEESVNIIYRPTTAMQPGLGFSFSLFVFRDSGYSSSHNCPHTWTKHTLSQCHTDILLLHMSGQA